MKSNSVKRAIFIDSVFLLLYLIGTGYVFSILMTSRPNAGNWYFIFLIFLIPGVCHRVFLIFHKSIYNKKERKHKWLSAIIAVVIGVILSGKITGMASTMAMDRFIAAYQPMIDALDAGQIPECENSNDEIEVPNSIRPRIKNQGRLNVDWATIHFSKPHFIISARGGSIDIDGSTIYYDSRTKEWELFHNDIEELKGKFENLIDNSISCRVAEQNI